MHDNVKSSCRSKGAYFDFAFLLLTPSSFFIVFFIVDDEWGRGGWLPGQGTRTKDWPPVTPVGRDNIQHIWTNHLLSSILI